MAQDLVITLSIYKIKLPFNFYSSGLNFDLERSTFYERDQQFNDDRDGNRSRNNWGNNASVDGRKRQNSSWRDDDRRYNRNESGTRNNTNNVKKNSRWGNNSPGEINNEEISIQTQQKPENDETASNDVHPLDKEKHEEEKSEDTVNQPNVVTGNNSNDERMDNNENQTTNKNDDPLPISSVPSSKTNESNDPIEVQENKNENTSNDKLKDKQSNINSNKDSYSLSNTTPLYDELQDMNDEQNNEKDNANNSNNIVLENNES